MPRINLLTLIVVLGLTVSGVIFPHQADLRNEFVKGFSQRQASNFETDDSSQPSKNPILVRPRRFLASQAWLPALIKQEEEDRNRRAEAQKKREKEEWEERAERRERDLAAERQERANINEREWRGWRGERHMQFERQERSEREDRGVRDEIAEQQDRAVTGSRQLREEEQEQSDTEERMERNERLTRQERNERTAMWDRRWREAIGFGREQRAYANRDRWIPSSYSPEQTEQKVGNNDYHFAEPEVAVGSSVLTQTDKHPRGSFDSEDEPSLEYMDSEEEHWHILKLY